MSARRRLPALAAVLSVLALGACSPADGPADPGTRPTAPTTLPSSRPSATPSESIRDDEVVPGCPDKLAEELGDVVGGVDVDGDGELDVIRYIQGDDGAAPGEGCARTVVAYLPGGQLAGFTLPQTEEMPDGVESLQPRTPSSSAYVSFRTLTSDGGAQPHLLALAGGSPDLRLSEVSLDGDGVPLLPSSPAGTPTVRAGFLCADGDLVGQVGAPRAEGGTTVWDITTTTYRLQNREGGDVAVPVDELTQTGVADDALRFGYPALLPESSANLCA
ncbi:hypothetical protein KLP28_16555 [Nocardioidaceae bacterium]|nr:hypothetical protein KLP28_16555 [Nocardioidaceae bacterium]